MKQADIMERIESLIPADILARYTHLSYGEMAEVYGRGYSHFTRNALEVAIHQPETAKRINEVELPAIFRRIAQLLTPEGA